jgi:eukaryotic-like serine/threonine-protein kinase
MARLAGPPDTTDVPEPWRDLLGAMTGLGPGNRPSATEVIAGLGDVMAAAAPAEEGTEATPTVVVGGAALGGRGAHELAPVDPHAPTGLMPAADGGTQVLPAVLVPEEPEPRPSRWAPFVGSVAGWMWARRALLAVLAGLAVLLIVAVSVAGDDGSEMPPPSTEPVAATPSTTMAPTTTSPPTTEAPSKDDGGKGRGRDKGKGNGDDD